MKLWVITIIVFLASFVCSEQYVMNSQDWTDIYSGMIFAKLSGGQGHFIVNEGHGLLIQNQLGKDETIVVESVENPFIRSYHLNLQATNIPATVRYSEGNLNLELATEVESEGFIVIDSRYSYNAVSVAPYAIRKGYYVLFANLDNIEEVVSIIEDKPVIVYGYVDREVTEALLDMNPSQINLGDKFANNLEIVKLYANEFGSTQIVLTNGAFLEPQFFSPSAPVLFIGQSNVPDATLNYLSESPVKHAILIGYDIFDNALTLKNQAGLKIIVKFAKGIDSKQYALDIFDLPQPVYNIGISSAVYNTYTKKLEVSYYNTEDYPAFMKASHTILRGNDTVGVVGDEDALFIGSTETLTVAYDAELSSDALNLRTSLLYGEDRGSLEYLDIIETTIETDSYEDSTEIDIKKVFYDTPTKRFHIVVQNTGEGSVFAKPVLIDVVVNNKQETLTDDAVRIEEGKKHVFKVKARLTPEDIADNEKITVGVRYGRRELSLINYFERSFDFKAKTISTGTMIVGVSLFVIAVILFFFWVQRRKRDKLGPAPRRR